MTAQRWEQIRNLKEVPVDVWHEYYLEVGGYIQDREMFWQIFADLLASNSYIRNSKGTLVRLTLNTALRRLYDYYNQKFQ